MRSEGPPGVVRYIAKVPTPDDGYPPALLRIVRNEDGYEREQRWSGRTREWRHSHVLLDYSYGKDNYDKLVDISPEQAAQVQAAWAAEIARQERERGR